MNQVRSQSIARSRSLRNSASLREIDWLRTWFIDDDRAVAGAIAQLRQLLGTRLVLEAPTLTDSVAAVRAARAARTTRDSAR